MLISTARATLYVILDAIERDLRQIIRDHILAYQSINQALTSDELPKAEQRLARYLEQTDSDPDDPLDAIDFLDLMDAVQILNRGKALLPRDTKNHIASRTRDFQKIVPIRNTVMHFRPLMMEDFPKVCEFANTLVSGNRGEWRILSETLDSLENNPSFLVGLELRFLERPETDILNNLPNPDFDDTGFVGRSGLLQKLVDAINGPFPVISVVGVGGIGKTALALKCAYDLLGQAEQEFDAIVWVSAKSSRLNVREIERVEGAIETSLGVFQAVQAEFGESEEDGALDRVVTLLENFRVLLIVDNLETVLDAAMKDFISRVPAGSKLLLTSRIGVGSGDLPIPVPQFNMNEARNYFRRLVQAYNVKSLEKLPQKKVDHFLKRLSQSPLFIKWFVTAVQTGSRPESLVANPELILQYCLDNVFSHLGEDAKQLCRCLIAVPGQHSIAILNHLSALDIERVEVAISELLICNVANMVQRESGSTAYELSALAVTYLKRIDPISERDFATIVGRSREIQSALEDAEKFTSADKFRFIGLTIESREQALVAKKLSTAMRAAANKDLEKSQTLIDEASALLPDYFEVERVRAYLRSRSGNLFGAKEAYETAIEMSPEHVPLYFWYGGFLQRSLNDLDGALEAYQRGLRIEPSDRIRCEVARVYMRQTKFDQAEKILSDLVSKDVPEREGRIYLEAEIQFYARKAEFLFGTGSDEDGLDSVGELREFLETIPHARIDRKHIQTVKKVANSLADLPKNRLSDLQIELVSDLESWLTGWLGRVSSNYSHVISESDGPLGMYASRKEDEHMLPSAADRYYPLQIDEGQIGTGLVHSIHESRKYAFITVDGGGELFFFSGNVRNAETKMIYVGCPVRFKVSRNAKGLVADDVQIVTSQQGIECHGRVYRATLTVLKAGETYGLGFSDECGSVLLRKAEFADAEQLGELQEGCQVEFVAEVQEKGIRGKDIKVVG